MAGESQKADAQAACSLQQELRTDAALGLAPAVAAALLLEEAALALAQKVASRPPEAVRLSKQLLRRPQREAVLETLKREGALFMERLQSEEAMGAFMAFMSKKSGG